MAIELTGLEGRVAVVTGAGRMRGIGHSIATEFARGGCNVVVTGSGRPPEQYPDDEKAAGWRDIESVADEIRAAGARALPLVVDVADEQAVDALLEATVREFGRVDFVVNNAASSRGNDRVPAVEMDVAEWDKVQRVNVRGTFLMSRAFGRRLIGQGEGGAIVNVSSVAGLRPPENASAYASSKAAIHALTASMAQEMGAHNVRVNAVCPGTVDTARMDAIPRGQVWDDRVRRNIPLGRASDGSEIAELTVFLCSEQGDWITGQAIAIDGGATVRRNIGNLQGIEEPRR